MSVDHQIEKALRFGERYGIGRDRVLFQEGYKRGRVLKHLEKHPNDRANLRIVARKYGIGVKKAHAQGIYWKKRISG